LRKPIKSLARRLALTGATLVFAISPGVAVSDEPVSLLFNKWARTEFLDWVVTPYLKEIERVTEGRVTYRFTGSSLAPSSRQYDMVAKRVADMSFVDISALREEIPSVQIVQLPLINSTTNTTAISIALWKTYEKFFEHAGEFSRAKPLAFFAFPPDHVLSRGEKIESLADLRGMKFMAHPGPSSTIMNALGPSVVPVPVIRSYEMVSRGVVDGILLNLSARRRFRLVDQLQSALYFPGGLISSAAAIVINNDAWASIAPKDQAAILSISGESYARQWTGDMSIDADNVLKAMQLEGNVSYADEALIDSIRSTGVVTRMRNDWVSKVEAVGIDGNLAIAYYQKQLAIAAQELSQ